VRLSLSPLLVVAALVAALPISSAAAQTYCPGTGTPTGVPLVTVAGGGFGANILPGNDDGSSSAIDLTVAFPGGLRFFGGPYTTAYVNNNGNITFSGPEYEYTPTPFPVASRPMIAPYWGDVDTRNGPTPTSADNLVYWDLSPGRMIVTWHNVGYFASMIDHRMDFQMILTNALSCGSGDFDVEFRYHECGWQTGSASGGSGGCGGTPAQAGFDAGDGVNFVEIPGSRTDMIGALCTTSNVGMPGIWQFSVRGGAVACPGTGTPCDTGSPGACGAGVTQCVGRTTVCSPVGTASGERCDGIDNDCNSMIDDGPGLCPAGQVCARGTCVAPCFEHSCADDQTCTPEGDCVDTTCYHQEVELGMPCPAGQRCIHGPLCVGACDGISCPHGQECVAGHCQDLCAVLTCNADEVCADGACIPTCPCHACAADETCGADGRCTPNGCDIVICDPGFYCDTGLCVDACAGAICPENQHCEIGVCVDGPPPVPDAGVPDLGTPETDAGMTTGDSGMTVGDAGYDAGRNGPHRSSGGCCSVPTSPLSGWPLPVGFALVLTGLVARRRRRGAA